MSTTKKNMATVVPPTPAEKNVSKMMSPFRCLNLPRVFEWWVMTKKADRDSGQAEEVPGPRDPDTRWGFEHGLAAVLWALFVGVVALSPYLGSDPFRRWLAIPACCLFAWGIWLMGRHRP